MNYLEDEIIEPDRIAKDTKPLSTRVDSEAQMPEFSRRKSSYFRTINTRDFPKKSKAFASEINENGQLQVANEEYFPQKRFFMEEFTPNRQRQNEDDRANRKENFPQKRYEENLEDQDLYVSKKPGEEMKKERIQSAAEFEAQLPENSLQKRFFMEDKVKQGDSHEHEQEFSREGATHNREHQRPPEFPERPLDLSENASKFKRLLDLRDRVGAMHKRLNEAIDKYDIPK